MLGKLLGNYRVVEQLGEGGMGVVYVGRHAALGHRVAVKVLRHELSHNAAMVQRFFHEAQAATAVRNPGIVQVFDFGTTPDGQAYLVMELLEGQTLAARMEQRQLDHAACCRIGRQVAKALQAAHACGITHRDLKPENLYLVRDDEVAGGERVKVLDFGIAKLASDAQSGAKTRTGAAMGTPLYMSPEQCRGSGTVDARTDIYALGCILFEMTCGRPPFVAEGAGEIVGAHLHVAPPHPRELAPGLPPQLASLIAKMLAKQPEARPQTMTAVGQALDKILGLLDGAPRMVPAAPPAATPALQRPPVSTTLGSSAGVTIDRARGKRPHVLVLAGVVVGSGFLGIFVMLAIFGSDAPRSSDPPQSSAGQEQAPAAKAATPATLSPLMPKPAVAEPEPEPAVAAPAPALAPAPAPAPESVHPPEIPGAAPDPPAETPRTVEVSIESTPPGAVVLLGSGAVFGKTPLRGTLPYGEQDVRLVVRLRGYMDKAIVVRPDKPISQQIKLAAPPRAPQRKDRDYGVNPFTK